MKHADRIKVLALASYPIEGASSRYRVAQFIAPLAERGIDIELRPFLDEALFSVLYKPRRLLRKLPRLLWRVVLRFVDLVRLIRSDVVLVQREAMLFGPPILEWFACRVLRRPMILDLDDATYLTYRSPVYGPMSTLLKWPGKTDRLIQWASIVTCGNPNVAAYVRTRGKSSRVIPTVADLALFFQEQPENEPPVIGWIGSHGTWPFLEAILPLFQTLAKERPFRLRIIGSGKSSVNLEGVDLDVRDWDLALEPADFRSLDIGLYPIGTDAWSENKSGFKAIQYMASGVPFVVSPVGMCAAIGIPETTHFEARNGDEWLVALRRLLADPSLRRTMGSAGRQFAEQQYGVGRQTDALEAVIRRVAAANEPGSSGPSPD